MTLSLSSAHSETIGAFRTKLKPYLQRCERFHDLYRSPTAEYSESVDYTDSLQDAQLALKRFLLTALRRLPLHFWKALTTKSDEYWMPNVVLSPNGKVATLDWDTDLGGTMPTIYVIIGHESGSSVLTRDLTDPGEFPCSWVDRIDTVSRMAGDLLYLIKQYSKGSTKDRGESIIGFEATDTSLSPANNLFVTPKKTYGHISVYYDMSLGSSENGIMYHSNSRTLSIPVIKGQEMTSNCLIYKFDGEHFVFQRSPRARR